MINPRLPMDFTDYDLDGPGGGRLIVIAGLPGTGKSTLAEQVARRLDIPLFSMDWLLGALTPFGGRAMNDLLGVGEELLTTLAVQQLSRGQSVILDARLAFHRRMVQCGAQNCRIRSVGRPRPRAGHRHTRRPRHQRPALFLAVNTFVGQRPRKCSQRTDLSEGRVPGSAVPDRASASRAPAA